MGKADGGNGRPIATMTGKKKYVHLCTKCLIIDKHVFLI